jgi:hypothetical protein
MAVVISTKDRDQLCEKLKSDPKFRELMKEDWKRAFSDVGINPAPLVGKNVEYKETVPLTGGPVASSIIIMIAAARADEVSIEDSVLFTK